MLMSFEQELFCRGIEKVAGVDEAGRGPLAGPVVAAAVIISKGYEFASKITDSKKLSAIQRKKAYDEIRQNCCVAFSIIDHDEIDRINILAASLKAMKESVESLSISPEWALIDGPHKPEVNIPCTAIISGDSKSISIAAASIIAKVTRDNIMVEYDEKYPEYGLAGHKGYGTKAHREAIYKHGPCPIHRKTFQPIKSMVK